MMPVFKDRKELIGIIICLASAVIFGLYPPASRAVYQDGGNITFVILVTTFCRLVGLYSMTIYNKQKVFEHFSEYKTSLLAGFFQAMSIIGILAAAFYLPGGVVMIIIFTHSLMLLFFSAWRGEMTVNIANTTSTIVALIGLCLVLGIGTYEVSYPMIGVTLAFMGAFATFVRIYIFGQQSKTRHPLVTGAETFIVAFALLLLLVFWDAPQPSETFFGAIMIATAALSLTIGSFGMFYGIAYLGSYKFSMIMKLEPIFTTLFGIVLVNDVLTTSQYLGIGVVLASLIALQLFDKQK